MRIIGLDEALLAFYAYETGDTGAGIHDRTLRQKVFSMLDSWKPKYRRIVLSRIVREAFLTDEAIEQGYGWEDALAFGRWLEDSANS